MRVIERFFGASSLGFILALAMFALCGDVVSLASARTSSGRHSFAGCDGLRAHLRSYFARASRVWDPNPWRSSEKDDISWRRERTLPLGAGLKFHSPVRRDLEANWGNEAQECSLTVWRRFYVDGDTIAFTMGRAPESCSEAPRMIWTDSQRREWRTIIPPLFNWNVETLWCTEHYLIFGLEADYEYGEHDERLAVWNLRAGRVVLSPGLAWGDSERTVRHEASLTERLPGWREARIAEVGEALVLTKRDTTLAFWPDRRAYFVGSHGGH